MTVIEILKDDKLTVEEKSKKLEELKNKEVEDTITDRVKREKEKAEAEKKKLEEEGKTYNERVEGKLDKLTTSLEESNKIKEQEEKLKIEKELLSKYGKDNLEEAKEFYNKGLTEQHIKTLLGITDDVVIDEDKVNKSFEKQNENKGYDTDDKGETKPNVHLDSADKGMI